MVDEVESIPIPLDALVEVESIPPRPEDAAGAGVESFTFNPAIPTGSETRPRRTSTAART
jgi:hypothetical protein